MSRGGDLLCSYCDESVDNDLSDNVRVYSRGSNIYLHVKCVDAYNLKMSRTCILCDTECDGEITTLICGEETPVHSDCIPSLQRNKLIYTMDLLLDMLEKFVKYYGHSNDLRVMKKRYKKIKYAFPFSPQEARAFIRDLHEMMSGDL